MKPFVDTCIRFFKKETVLCVAGILAFISAFFVHPSAAYIGYIDFRVLSLLFCLMLVVAGFQSIGLFHFLGSALLTKVRTTRQLILVLSLLCFFSSMFITNDVSLLTFVPFGIMILTMTGQQKLLISTIVLQTIGANLGSMFTPVGNPQNLYLFNHYNIPNGEFLSIMLPPFLLSTALILLCCLFLPREGLTVPRQETLPDKRHTAVYGVLFCVAVAMVLRGIPYWLGLLVIVMALLVLDRRALLGVDWGLLVTFAAFFTFSGNMARIEPVRELFRKLLTHGAMPVAALTSQVISNVPAAILLSRFTDDYRGLLVGVNIGGAGTLVASLASLITFREYTKHVKGQTGRFMVLFSAISFGFLGVLLVAMTLWMR